MSDIRNLVADITKLNNQAIVRMHCGDLASAMSTLTSLFTTSKQLLNRAEFDHQQENNKSGATEDSRITRTNRPRYYKYLEEVKSSIVGNACEDWEDESSSCPSAYKYYMCSRPLQLQEPRLCAAEKSHGTSTTASYHEHDPKDMLRFANISTYVVIYNLALCYHLRGITSCSAPSSSSSASPAGCAKSKSKQSLEQAVALYRCARNVLDISIRDDYQECLEDDRSTSMHAVVLFNNSFHAKYLLMQDEESVRECRSVLSNTVMLLLLERQSCPPTNDNRIEDTILDNIAMVLIIGPASAAPAA